MTASNGQPEAGAASSFSCLVPPALPATVGAVTAAVQVQRRPPVCRAGPLPGAVHGLDRGLELEAPQLPTRVRRPEVFMRPVDELRVPQRRVLVGQWDETSGRVQTRRGARR